MRWLARSSSTREPPLARLALLLLLAACSDTRSGADCREASDCGSPAEAYRCDPDTGACLCRTDAACPPGELCNAAGFCQDARGLREERGLRGPGPLLRHPTGTCLAARALHDGPALPGRRGV